MLNKILKATDAYKRQPRIVQKFTMEQVGSKYHIKVHFDDAPAKVIGRYNTRREAHTAMEQLKELTNSEILK